MNAHIIDDDPAIRQMISTIFAEERIPASLYASGAEFLSRGVAAKSGCIVLDLKMPGMEGLELLERLRGLDCQLPVIIISGHADVADAVRGMQLGATDLLQKPFKIDKLVSLVRTALASNAAALEEQEKSNQIRARFEALTPRELEMVQHIVAGSSSKAIARSLNISVRTVANHRAHLMAKTRASNAADLARLATIAGLLPAQSSS
jgi:two-component system response regulator FixJ